ncbi:MAG: hypothetical protein PHQ75_11115 [Thermoguttaceae bacterium]|nr:hypothetical protein [Thermoguttaceae bacterium]
MNLLECKCCARQRSFIDRLTTGGAEPASGNHGKKANCGRWSSLISGPIPLPGSRLDEEGNQATGVGFPYKFPWTLKKQNR